MPATSTPFSYLGAGRNRIAFRHGKWVIKVPLNKDGMTDNYHEAWVYREYRRSPEQYDIQFARCRLIPNSDILVMELLETENAEEPPTWSGSVDCGQVGIGRDGRWLAYDFGLL